MITTINLKVKVKNEETGTYHEEGQRFDFLGDEKSLKKLVTDFENEVTKINEREAKQQSLIK